MKPVRPNLTLPLAATAMVLSAGCPHALAEAIVGLAPQNQLVVFDSANPGVISSSMSVSGLAAGDTLVGIDFRPATGQLYGMGRFSSLYLIDPASASASSVGSGTFTPSLAGDAFGFDFNPTVDRIRVVSDSGQNLRLHPVTGVVAANDAGLRYSSTDPNFTQLPQVVGAAYTENVAGARTTTLYGVDSVLDVLVRQSPPNDGVLNTVGSLGVNITDAAGFDISGATGTAFASFFKAGDSGAGLYSVNLATGSASWLGDIGLNQSLIDIAVVPEPGTWTLVAMALSGLCLARRRRV